MKRAPIAKRLQATSFVDGAAQVTLDGQHVATLYRTPGWIEAEVMGEPYGGGRNLKTALRSVAVGYQVVTGQWEA